MDLLGYQMEEITKFTQNTFRSCIEQETFVVIGRMRSADKADACHIRGARSRDASHAIFNDKAPGWRHGHGAGRVLEDVGTWLATRDKARRKNVRIDEFIKARLDKTERESVRGRAGSDATSNGQRLKNVFRPPNGLKINAVFLKYTTLYVCFDRIRKGTAHLSLDFRVDRLARNTTEPAGNFFGGDAIAGIGQRVRFRRAGNWLAVNQDAITIENYQLGDLRGFHPVIVYIPAEIYKSAYDAVDGSHRPASQ